MLNDWRTEFHLSTSKKQSLREISVAGRYINVKIFLDVYQESFEGERVVSSSG